jgi:hypothetical protein
MGKIVIAIELREIQELQRILLDSDAPAAVDFLRDCIAPKVAVYTEAKHCKPTFEWGSTEPPLLKSLKKKTRE